MSLNGEVVRTVHDKMMRTDGEKLGGKTSLRIDVHFSFIK